MKIGKLATAFLLVLTAIGCDVSPTPNPTPVVPTPTPLPPTEALPTVTPYTNVLKWHYQQAATVGASAVITGGLVIFGDQDGLVHALDEDTGHEQWSFDVHGRVYNAPVALGGVVYAGASVGTGEDSRGDLIAIDAKRGREVWRYATKGDTVTSPVLSGTLVIFGSSDSYMHALAASTGEPVWQAKLDDAPSGDPAASRGAVYIGDGAGNFYALDAATGKQLWKLATGKARTGTAQRAITSPFVSSDGSTVYFANTFGGPVFAVDATTGETRWRFEIADLATPSPTFSPDEKNAALVTSPPVVQDGKLYVGVSFGVLGGEGPDRAGYLYAVDAPTGRRKWRVEAETEITARPVAGNGVVYYASKSGTLHAADLQTGRSVFAFEADGPVSASPVLDSGVLYFGSWAGSFYALDAK